MRLEADLRIDGEPDLTPGKVGQIHVQGFENIFKIGTKVIVVQTCHFETRLTGALNVQSQAESATTGQLEARRAKRPPLVFNILHEADVQASLEVSDGPTEASNRLVVTPDPTFRWNLDHRYPITTYSCA